MKWKISWFDTPSKSRNEPGKRYLRSDMKQYFGPTRPELGISALNTLEIMSIMQY